MAGMGDTPEDAEEALLEALRRTVARGTFLQTSFLQENGELIIYFLNTPKGRASVLAIQRGEWRPSEIDAAPAVLRPTPPNIFRHRLALAITSLSPQSTEPTGAPKPFDKHSETES